MDPAYSGDTRYRGLGAGAGRGYRDVPFHPIAAVHDPLVCAPFPVAFLALLGNRRAQLFQDFLGWQTHGDFPRF
jgi:hypothetical protein